MCVLTVTGSATKLKTGKCRPKQREQLRTLNASQTNNIMRDSMHVSAVCAVFGPPLSVLSFVADPVTVNTHMSTFTYQFCGAQLAPFPANLAIIVRNVTSHNKQRCVIAKFELKVWRYPNFVYVK